MRVTADDPTRLEIRLIDSSSPHFVLLECWALWDGERHEFLRVPGSSDRIRRFYTVAAAKAFRTYNRPGSRRPTT
ncbi:MULTISPECIES: hypothetical protein [Streptomyces]|uniref:hypothetical protein n=1 Tax=Streptomyces TaxID=1883 RepID=UPI0004A9DC5B|nr:MULTISPECIES: hypothetical protein [Streptomyces]